MVAFMDCLRWNLARRIVVESLRHIKRDEDMEEKQLRRRRRRRRRKGIY